MVCPGQSSSAEPLRNSYSAARKGRQMPLSVSRATRRELILTFTGRYPLLQTGFRRAAR